MLGASLRNREHGFTMIELMVVLLIVGLLAAVAVPIFQNQQRTSRDASTKSDVNALAMIVKSAVFTYPAATEFKMTGGAGGKATVSVGNSPTETQSFDVYLTEGTTIALMAGSEPGEFKVFGYNINGKNYNNRNTVVMYDSTKGRISDDAFELPTHRENLATNPSFESGSTSGWAPYFAASQAIVNDGKEGTRALRWTTVDSTRAQGGWHTITREWKVGDVISTSVWVKAPSGQRMTLGLRANNHLGAGHGAVGFVGTGAWQQVSMTYTVPSPAQTYYAPQVITQSPLPPVGAQIFVDGLLVELAESTGSYVEGSTSGTVPSNAWVTVRA